MIRPLDDERCNRGITFKRNKIMRKQINNLVIALAFILTIGCLVGCVKQEREKSRQAQTATSSTTKEDKETIFDYSVTDPRTGFSWRKNHESDQKTRTEDNNHFFKESRTEIKRRNKKRATGLSKRTRTEGH